MKNIFRLKTLGKMLWTREHARAARAQLNSLVEATEAGDTVMIDVAGVDVFDFSFANEFFGKSVMGLTREFPGRFLVVENLNDYTRENLSMALQALNLSMVERAGTKLRLIGKVHPADQSTFAAVVTADGPTTAAKLRDALGINLTAINERLSKLCGLGILHRIKGVSAAGREQYEYAGPE